MGRGDVAGRVLGAPDSRRHGDVTTAIIEGRPTDAACDVFIVGAPKCGTTAMHTYLNSHPDVCMSADKEPIYFGRDLNRLERKTYTVAAYEALFGDARPSQLRGEASVYSLVSATAADEIADYNPAARIIIMLRDPVDMFAAWHGERLSVGTEDIMDPATALAAWPDRAAGHRLPWNRRDVLEGLDYRRMIDFVPQVARYRARFDPEQIHVVFQDDLRDDTLGEINRCLAFLGLEPHLDEPPEAVNTAHVLKRPWLNRLVRSSVAETMRDLLPSRLVLPVGRKLRRAAFSYGARPPLDPALEAELVAEMAAGIPQLEELLGVEVPWRSRFLGMAPHSSRIRVA